MIINLSPSILRRKKVVLAGFSIFFLAIVIILAIVFLPSGQQVAVSTDQSSPIPVLSTAYGSQRHLFSLAGKLVAVWVNKENLMAFSLSEDQGTTWEDLSSPVVAGKVETVAGAQDNEDSLHLVYESEGKIFYRKVDVRNWTVSKAVGLDLSGFAHRPSLILEKESGLPAVVWSREGKGIIRSSSLGFMRAVGDPTSLKKWCNAEGSACGLPAYVNTAGSADWLGLKVLRSVFHPVLVQMPTQNDLYIFWSDSSGKGNESLKKTVGTKKEGGWSWGKISLEDQVHEETFKNFTLAAVADPGQKRLFVTYKDKEGGTKVMVYYSDGRTERISPEQNFGRQFSLVADQKAIYLVYRKENGKIAGRQYETSWSEELFESPQECGYPSTVVYADKLLVVCSTPAGKVEFLSAGLVLPTPTPLPTELSVSPTPSQTVTPTSELLPTIELTPTETPTIEPTPTVSE